MHKCKLMYSSNTIRPDLNISTVYSYLCMAWYFVYCKYTMNSYICIYYKFIYKLQRMEQSKTNFNVYMCRCVLHCYDANAKKYLNKSIYFFTRTYSLKYSVYIRADEKTANVIYHIRILPPKEKKMKKEIIFLLYRCNGCCCYRPPRKEERKITLSHKFTALRIQMYVYLFLRELFSFAKSIRVYVMRVHTMMHVFSLTSAIFHFTRWIRTRSRSLSLASKIGIEF